VTRILEQIMPGQDGAAAADAAPAQRCVYVIDDDIDIRKSLHFLLATSSITAWPFASAIDFIDQLPALVPGPILLDVRMPDIDGLQMLHLLNERSIGWPVVVITAHGDVTTAVRAMKLGAIEFLEKPFKAHALDRVLEQAFVLLDQSARQHRARDDARQRIGRLTPREVEVMTVLMKGTLNKIAAYQLGLSVRTVEMHRTNALAKLGLHSLAEVVALFTTADADGAHVRPGAARA
jgi:two-component system response regulator FixJ